MDWDRIKKNVMRSGTFVGNGLQDEDAYYDFFADDIDCFPANKTQTWLRDAMGHLRVVTARYHVMR